MNKSISNKLQHRKIATIEETILNHSIEHPTHKIVRVIEALSLRGVAVNRSDVLRVWEQHKILSLDNRIKRSLSDSTIWISQSRAAKILDVELAVVMNATDKGYFRTLEIEGCTFVDRKKVLEQYVEYLPSASTEKVVLAHSFKHPVQNAVRVAQELVSPRRLITPNCVRGVWNLYALPKTGNGRLKYERLQQNDSTVWISKKKALRLQKNATADTVVTLMREGRIRAIRAESHVLVDRANMIACIKNVIKKSVLAYSLANPTHGPARISKAMKRRGYLLHASSVQRIWQKCALPTQQARIERKLRDSTEWIRIGTAARLWDIESPSLQSLVDRGFLRTMKIEDHVFVDRADMLKYNWPEIEETILAYTFEHLTRGSKRIARELRLLGYPISMAIVQRVWERHGLLTREDRLKRGFEKMILAHSLKYPSLGARRVAHVFNISTSVVQGIWKRHGLLKRWARLENGPGKTILDYSLEHPTLGADILARELTLNENTIKTVLRRHGLSTLQNRLKRSADHRADEPEPECVDAPVPECEDRPELMYVPESGKSPDTEEVVVGYSLEYPTHSQRRIVQAMNLLGHRIDGAGVRQILRKHGLIAWQERLKRKLHDPTDWIPLGEIARIWKMQTKAAKLHIRNGHFRTLKYDGRILVDRDDVLKYLPCINREAVLTYCRKYPIHGPNSIARALQMRGYQIGSSTVFGILKRFALTRREDRVRLTQADPTDWISRHKAAWLWKTTFATMTQLVQEGRFRTLEVQGRIFIDKRDLLKKRQQRQWRS